MPHQVPDTSEVHFDFFGTELGLSEYPLDEDDGNFFDLVAGVDGSEHDFHLERVALADDFGHDLFEDLAFVEPVESLAT